MKRIIQILNESGMLIIIPLVIIIFFKTCSTNSRITKSEKNLTNKVDSLTFVVSQMKNVLSNEIKVEGLKSEKRMIQSTDRKILDVNRQTEIDKELSKLEK